MDAYVSFMLSKPLNKNTIRNYFVITISKNIKQQILPKKSQLIFEFYVSQDNSEFSFLFSDLNNRNGTYASLAFISGVGHKNSSIHWKTTAF